MKRLSMALVAALFIFANVPAVSAFEDGEAFVWRVWRPGHRALLNAAGDVSGGGRIEAALHGLMPNHDYRIIGTNAGSNCSSAATAANRTFVIDENADFSGNVFVAAVTNGATWQETDFVRVKELGGATWACSPVTPYFFGPTVPSGAVASFPFGDGSMRAIALVQQTSDSEMRLTVAVGFITDNEPIDITLRGVDARCGRKGDTVFQLKMEDVVVARFASMVVPLGTTQLRSLRSVRLRGTGDNDWLPDCRKSTTIDLLVP